MGLRLEGEGCEKYEDACSSVSCMLARDFFGLQLVLHKTMCIARKRWRQG